jgi:rod shape-determining protein MreC
MKQLFKSRSDLALLALLLFGHLILLATQSARVTTTPLLRSFILDSSAWILRASSGIVAKGSQWWQDYINLRGAREENRRLKEQIAGYEQQVALYREKLRESNRQHWLEELEQALQRPGAQARIIGADATQWYNSRILDRGSNAGIVRDCAVLSPEGVVGRIVHVSPHSSVMQLITDTESGVGVFLENSRAQGVLRGEGKLDGTLEYIRNGEQVAAGERVLTSGLDQVYPKGLLVGYVTQVLPTHSLYKQVKVGLSARIERLEDVLVILKPAIKSNGK